MLRNNIAALLVLCTFESVAIAQTPVEKNDYTCLNASMGELNPALIKKDDRLQNSYLLTCVLSPVALEPGYSHSAIKKMAKGRLDLGNRLLISGIDVNYENKDGTTLLMFAALSFMSTAWREKLVRELLEKGIDTTKKNAYGFTALDYAHDERNATIEALIKKHINK
jgi:ankyrin repeat protein